MAIIRKQRLEYSITGKGRIGKHERKMDDWDLAWGDMRVYVLDSHEWFDPRTSSKYHEGVSRHAMYGPSVIVVSPNGAGGTTTHESHVNDPRTWAWIRRCIADGYLSAQTMTEGPPNNEREIEVTV